MTQTHFAISNSGVPTEQKIMYFDSDICQEYCITISQMLYSSNTGHCFFVTCYVSIGLSLLYMYLFIYVMMLSVAYLR
jgi:hypothetical protein